MKTKYILHGGSAQHTNAENDKFFKEIFKGTGNTVKILLVHFAGTPERAEKNKKIDTAQFERVKGDKLLTFQIAFESTFYDQIAWADVVYFGGGTTVRLLEALQHFKGLKDKFAGKIIAGESAGANILTAYCYSKSGGGVIKGLGILPIKFMPHFNGEQKEKLEEIPAKLAIVTLENYQFKVFEIREN
jgi:cyanophycinase-like exopeptidase